MAADHKKDFSKKHPQDKSCDPVLADEVKQLSQNGRLPCAVAFDIARKNNVPVREVGVTLDLLNIRLTKCQLGLFGYSPEKKIIKPDEAVEEALMEAVKKAMEENRLSCDNAWAVASRLNIPKMAVSRACETLGVKIKPCQLGAF
jgi:hypothetical protein